MVERKLDVFKNYFWDFIATLSEREVEKVYYALDLLKTQHRISKKFVKFLRDGLYELRVEYNSNIYRVFFIFDDGNVVVLFNGFHKKTQKLPKQEISKALEIKKEYEREKQ